MGIYHSLDGNWKFFRLWEFACVSEPINCSLKSVWIKIRIFENVVMWGRKESNLEVSLGQYQICVSQVLHLLPWQGLLRLWAHWSHHKAAATTSPMNFRGQLFLTFPCLSCIQGRNPILLPTSPFQNSKPSHKCQQLVRVIKDRLDFFALGTKLHLFKFSFSLGTRNLSCKGSWNLSEWAWNQVCVSITMPNPVKSVLITAWWCEGAPAWHGSVSTARMACTLSMRKGEGKARPSHHCESLITYRHHLLSAKLTPSLPQPEDWVHSAGF